MRHQSLVFKRVGEIRRSEVLAAFTYALDLGGGLPPGHSIRACFIAATLARELGLDPTASATVYYTALLKDLGCSSNAARIYALYGADDLAFKAAWKRIAPGRRATLGFVLEHTACATPLKRRAAALGRVLVKGDAFAQELIEMRCARGADLARELRFGESVVAGIYHLDERWDGSGRPRGLRGRAIPLASRLALLAQVADVFHQADGRHTATEEVARRARTWLDPELVRTFVRVAEGPRFWAQLESTAIDMRVASMAPEENESVDDRYLDEIVAAFGKVIDAKSPFTAGHSARVANHAVRLGERLGVLPTRLERLRRAATLHDIGKLAVSSAILEKSGPLDEAEWAAVRAHASHTQMLLGRIGALADLAPIAAAHHERLDGQGYPLGLDATMLARETRIISLCDAFDALTSERPYRAALPIERALAVIEADVGSGFDPEGFEALKALVAG
jgi:HD-GYP domain-containing protein (c-di-GMP phosphodiesterase class II)